MLPIQRMQYQRSRASAMLLVFRWIFIGVRLAGLDIAAMGQLTASIAHEIRQTLSAVKMGGSTALRWLTKYPPEINGARRSIESIVKDANLPG
jgi:signal transduction histidine kinase